MDYLDLYYHAFKGLKATTGADKNNNKTLKTLQQSNSDKDFLETKRVLIKNEPDIFGKQLIVDENDEPCGEEPYLLINAVNLSLDEAFDEVVKRGGVCYPAHIDRSSNGIISMLGDFPPEPRFTAFELNDIKSFDP